MCEHVIEKGDWNCSKTFDCCDCGGNNCGCAYCWSCNACEECLEESLSE